MKLSRKKLVVFVAATAVVGFVAVWIGPWIYVTCLSGGPWGGKEVPIEHGSFLYRRVFRDGVMEMVPIIEPVGPVSFAYCEGDPMVYRTITYRTQLSESEARARMEHLLTEKGFHPVEADWPQRSAQSLATHYDQRREFRNAKLKRPLDVAVVAESQTNVSIRVLRYE